MKVETNTPIWTFFESASSPPGLVTYLLLMTTNRDKELEKSQSKVPSDGNVRKKYR